MLGARNSSRIDELHTRARQESLGVFYVSQSYFGLPRQSIRNKSDRLILCKQTIRAIQSLYYDIGAHDMKDDEFREICHKAWSERFNYPCIDMTKNMKVNIVFPKKAKPNISNVFPKVNLSYKINDISNKRYRRFERFKQVSIVTKSSTSSETTR